MLRISAQLTGIQSSYSDDGKSCLGSVVGCSLFYIFVLYFVSNHRRSLIACRGWGFLVLTVLCWVVWSLLKERLTLHREQPCIAGGYPYWEWSWASRVLGDSKEPRSLQQSRQWKTARRNMEQKKPSPRGLQIFFHCRDPEGSVQTSLQCKPLFKKQLSYWTKTWWAGETFFIKYFCF